MKPQPFLATLAPAAPAPRPLISALRALSTPDATSPWSPKPEVAAVAPAIDVEAVREAARAEGREQGLQETAALRAQLARLADELARARETALGLSADQIAEAACEVIAAWTETTPKTELFAPLVRSWVAKVQDATVATVHPDDADALRTVIGDAAIAIQPDPAIARGDLRLRSPTRELTHEWSARLAELRESL
jgi:flagellar biosynthesis/type III secretory pathway protein FliH